MSSFRYERLMEVKEKLLELKQRELDMAMVALGDIISRIAAVGQKVARAYNDMTGRCLTGKELTVLVGYIALLDTQKATLNEEKSRMEERVNTMRSELYDLEIELKMFEKLKSKALQTIKKARNRKERKLMDEIALRGQGL